MKTITVTFLTLLVTTSIVLATGGGSPSIEELYKASRQGKPVVKLIDGSTEKTIKTNLYLLM